MSEKLSTIILKVDLQCSKCYKKIQDTLSKLQDRYNIRSIVYDEKNNTVTICGPFDPNKLIKKICCKACKVIQDIQIVEDKPNPVPPPPAVPDPPPPEPEPAPAPPAQPEPPPPAPPEPEPAPPAPEPEPEPPKPDPPQKVEPAPPAPEPVAKPPEPVYPYPYPNPGWTTDPGCCCRRPWYEAYHGGCRCCSCGCVYGPVNHYPPPPPVVYMYGGPCYDRPKTCEFICEEQPSTCVIM